MQAPIACVTRAWRSFGRLTGSRPSSCFWAWSWDPLKFLRRHPPHHLSPARAIHPAGQDPEAHLSRPSHHSNAPIKPEGQSILSKIVALTPSKGSFGKSSIDHRRVKHNTAIGSGRGPTIAFDWPERSVSTNLVCQDCQTALKVGTA